MNAHTIARLTLSGMASRNGGLPLVWAGLFQCNALLRQELGSPKRAPRSSRRRRTLRQSRTRPSVPGHLPLSSPYPTPLF
jgi:hypothetical protein